MKFTKSIKIILVLGFLLATFFAITPVIVQAESPIGNFGLGSNPASGYIGSMGKMLWSPVSGGLGFVANALISGTLMLFNTLAGFALAWAMAAIDLTTSSVLIDAVMFSPQAIEGINAGWGLVRDFVNMFFILILVFLAIATILRINKYSDKRLLFFVIFAALLVNFSKPITIFIIDISNLAMSFFIQNIQDANTSYSVTMLHNMDFEQALKSDISGSDIGRYVGLLAGAIFKFILAMMMFVLAASLIIRIVALWVLIVLSPLAFFGIAMPGTFLSALKDGWVKKLVYWCFFGPVLLFFLWLSLVLISAITATIASVPDPELTFRGMTFGDNVVTFIVGALKITVPFIASIYMLFYGYSLTKSMSAGMGNSVLGVMNKGQGMMSRWGKRGAAVAGTMATGGLGYLGYKQYQGAKTGLSQNEKVPFSEASRKKADAKRTASYAGKSNQFEAGEVNDQMKEWEEKGAPSSDELKKTLRAGKNKIKVQAAAMRLAKEGDLSKEDYGNSMPAFQKNPKLQQRFEQNAKKHNLHAKLEYDIDQAMNAKKQSIGGAEVSAADKNQIRSDKYSEALQGMTLSKIKDQDINFHKSPDFQAHMKGRVASGRESIENLRKLDMSGDKKEVWKNAGWFAADTELSPEQKRYARMNPKSGTDGDMTPEQERDAMRDMNT